MRREREGAYKELDTTKFCERVKLLHILISH